MKYETDEECWAVIREFEEKFPDTKGDMTPDRLRTMYLIYLEISDKSLEELQKICPVSSEG